MRASDCNYSDSSVPAGSLRGKGLQAKLTSLVLVNHMVSALAHLDLSPAQIMQHERERSGSKQRLTSGCLAVGRERLDKAPKLKLSITAGIGSDHVDLNAAAENGLTVAEATGTLLSHALLVSICKVCLS